jgi:hypothetical protein
MEPLTESDRQFVDRCLELYGPLWAGGLAAIERSFDIDATADDQCYRLLLTRRNPTRVSYVLELGKSDGRLSHRGPNLPDGPPLASDELALVDQVLKRTGELWLCEPLNEACVVVNLSDGLNGLSDSHVVHTRRVDQRDVLYFIEKNDSAALLCVWLDRVAQAIDGVCWVAMPDEAGGRWLSPPELAFLERALREHGDFGVYGNLQAGFRELVNSMRVQLRDHESMWHISAVPHDGHGHEFSFSVDKSSGTIGNCCVGHSLPEPSDIE